MTILQSFVPVADAIAILLQPHAEVVLHDLGKGTIHHIANGFSRRRPGDSSLTELEDVVSFDQPVLGPYGKINWDGRSLKSISAVLNDATGAPVGLLCINVDVSMFEALHAVAGAFLRFADTAVRPSALFENDWREDVNGIVGQFVSERGLSLSKLTVRDRSALIAALDARGLFSVRNAAPYIAGLLKLSRATLYKTLKQVREETQPPVSRSTASRTAHP